MIFDDLGLPKVSGATDLQDSAALAGIMTTFGWPQAIDLKQYIVFENCYRGFVYVRHPVEDKGYDFSRDQFICLIAGLRTSGVIGNFYVSKHRITGHDLLTPSVHGHIARCQGGKANWFQDAWFWADLWFSAKFKPLDELNQLFCMMMVADPKFIRWYCKANPQWEKALRIYWYEGLGVGLGDWRDEEELCEWMILKIREKLLG